MYQAEFEKKKKKNKNFEIMHEASTIFPSDEMARLQKIWSHGFEHSI